MALPALRGALPEDLPEPQRPVSARLARAGRWATALRAWGWLSGDLGWTLPGLLRCLCGHSPMLPVVLWARPRTGDRGGHGHVGGLRPFWPTGCYPRCPPEAPTFDEDQMRCVATCPPPPCQVQGKSYWPGAVVPAYGNCLSWYVTTWARGLGPVGDPPATPGGFILSGPGGVSGLGSLRGHQSLLWQDEGGWGVKGRAKQDGAGVGGRHSLWPPRTSGWGVLAGR